VISLLFLCPLTLFLFLLSKTWVFLNPCNFSPLQMDRIPPSCVRTISSVLLIPSTGFPSPKEDVQHSQPPNTPPPPRGCLPPLTMETCSPIYKELPSPLSERKAVPTRVSIDLNTIMRLLTSLTQLTLPLCIWTSRPKGPFPSPL